MHHLCLCEKNLSHVTEGFESEEEQKVLNS